MKRLFTSDVAYYGDQFLPKREDFPVVLKSFSKLIELCEKQENLELYPSHNSYPCDITLITDLYKGIENIENLWDTKKPLIFLKHGRLMMKVVNSDITFLEYKKSQNSYKTLFSILHCK